MAIVIFRAHARAEVLRADRPPRQRADGDQQPEALQDDRRRAGAVLRRRAQLLEHLPVRHAAARPLVGQPRSCLISR